MSESIFFIFLGLLRLCSTLLLFVGSIILFKREKSLTAYLLLTGTMLFMMAYLIVPLFALLEMAVSMSTRIFFVVTYIQPAMMGAGFFFFGIGFFKLITTSLKNFKAEPGTTPE